VGKSVAKKLRRRVIDRGALPSDLGALIGNITSEDLASEWGLKAALYVTRFRKRSGHGPTFAELFDGLGLSGASGDATTGIAWDRFDTHVLFSFRLHVAVQWKRDGWIYWTGTSRSLRAGPMYSEAARRYQQRRRGQQT